MSTTATIQALSETVQKDFKPKSGRPILPSEIGTDYNFKREIVWFKVIGFIIWHLCALYGLYLAFFLKFQTIIWGNFLGWVSGLSSAGAAHRCFSHHAFKPTLPLKVAFVIGQTISGQNCIFTWVRDHRLHHKFSDTDADPHNANRGFFFSHMGWLMSKKHPLVIEKGRAIDMSDMEADPLVMFQKKYYIPLYFLFGVFMPIMVPVYFWNESFSNAMFTCYFLQHVITLNMAWTVNSFAHLYGAKPYDKNIKASESSFIAAMSMGEWHNYHHTFPWDYKNSEFGARYGVITSFIETLEKLGLATDLKTAPLESIKNTIIKKGDGSHPIYGKGYQEDVDINLKKLASF